MQKALPITLLLLPAAIAVLYLVIKPDLSARIAIDRTPIHWDKQQKLPSLSLPPPCCAGCFPPLSMLGWAALAALTP